MTVHIHTDGSCHDNPGPGGWAAVILTESGENCTLKGGSPETTNNIMELTAVIRGLRNLDNMPWTKGSGILIHTDSQHIVNALTNGWTANWRKNGWRTANRKPVANRELWEELIPLVEMHSPEWVWVKGHSGEYWNELCGQIANEEAGQACREREEATPMATAQMATADEFANYLCEHRDEGKVLEVFQVFGDRTQGHEFVYLDKTDGTITSKTTFRDGSILFIEMSEPHDHLAFDPNGYADLGNYVEFHQAGHGIGLFALVQEIQAGLADKAGPGESPHLQQEYQVDGMDRLIINLTREWRGISEQLHSREEWDPAERARDALEFLARQTPELQAAGGFTVREARAILAAGMAGRECSELHEGLRQDLGLTHPGLLREALEMMVDAGLLEPGWEEYGCAGGGCAQPRETEFSPLAKNLQTALRDDDGPGTGRACREIQRLMLAAGNTAGDIRAELEGAAMDALEEFDTLDPTEDQRDWIESLREEAENAMTTETAPLEADMAEDLIAGAADSLELYLGYGGSFYDDIQPQLRTGLTMLMLHRRRRLWEEPGFRLAA